jgi:hypothetical protein
VWSTLDEPVKRGLFPRHRSRIADCRLWMRHGLRPARRRMAGSKHSRADVPGMISLYGQRSRNMSSVLSSAIR